MSCEIEDQAARIEMKAERTATTRPDFGQSAQAQYLRHVSVLLQPSDADNPNNHVEPLQTNNHALLQLQLRLSQAIRHRHRQRQRTLQLLQLPESKRISVRTQPPLPTRTAYFHDGRECGQAICRLQHKVWKYLVSVCYQPTE